MNKTMLRVEVAYAMPDKQKIVVLDVEEGTSVKEVVMQSNIETFFPGLDKANAKLGIFGKSVRKPEEQEIKQGERVEIYRELTVDPKKARANRAAKGSE
ncbi:RnfH family protein [Marinomonas sp. PE14-40]|uniref:RnfH family protein n=1 Tax=Marinomonas sp. PE14-40 TaxID=3060621 RepID=UPI003F670AC1